MCLFQTVISAVFQFVGFSSVELGRNSPSCVVERLRNGKSISTEMLVVLFFCN